jgi:hypothetical protein
MSNVHSDLSLKRFQGEVHDFPGEVQKFSGEVKNDLRGGAHLPSKSGHESNLTNRISMGSVLSRTVRDRLGLRLGLLELS